jgi:superoxide reductase
MIHSTRAIAAAAMLAVAGAAAPAFPQGQAEQFTPEFRGVHTTFDEKHTPRIEAPASVKRGEWFDVTVTVPHPSLAEHFVRSVALFKDAVEISRVYLHPVFSQPRVRFTIALDEGGMLRALAEPTHSAAWEGSRPIRVER